MNDDPLVQFYRGLAPDNRGRYLDEILAWDDDKLEYTHDYIQWLFPITTIGVNPDAPPASAATAEAFRSDASLREALRRSLERMLAFYGLERDGNRIVPRKDFEARRSWLTPGNHNHLRLTRILRCLRLLGDGAAAQALHGCLILIVDADRAAGKTSVSDTTLQFWSEAVND